MNNKKRTGFTLIELLATIFVLSLIVGIVILIVNITMDDVSDKLDEATKNMILDAANEYALEYRDSDRWIEKKTTNGSSFCVSLDSLIDSGYFTNEKSNYDKFRNKYAVSCNIEKGVFNYEFVELDKITDDDDICKYAEKESLLVEKDETTNEYVVVDKISKSSEIINDSKKLGDFKYDVIKDTDMKYTIDVDLDLKIKDFINDNSNIYVNVLLDESGSMAPVYSDVTKAITNFSKSLGEKGIKSSLIGFGDFPVLRRGYDASSLAGSFADKAIGWATNAMAGVDLATSLVYNDETINENSKIYTIMFFDGDPFDWSWLKRKKDAKEIKVEDFKTAGYNFGKNVLAKEYYKNYKDAVLGCGGMDDTSDVLVTCDAKEKKYAVLFQNSPTEHTDDMKDEAWQKLEYSSGFLKALGSKMIIIAYRQDFETNIHLKNVISQDDKICNNAPSKDYCYYKSSNVDEIKNLYENLATNIVEVSLVDKIKLTLEPLVDSNNVPLVKIYDEDGNEVNNLKEIDLSDKDDLKIINRFKFVINNEVNLFNEKNMKCDEEEKVCSYQGPLQLLNIKLGLHYKSDLDNEWSYVDIGQPEFDLQLIKLSTIN